MYGYADPGQLGLGYGTQLFMTTEGKVYVAGDNIDGAAGNGTTSNVLEWTESTPPTTYGKIKAFAFGVKYSFAISEQLTYTEPGIMAPVSLVSTALPTQLPRGQQMTLACWL